jgi:hypothetical protein
MILPVANHTGDCRWDSARQSGYGGASDVLASIFYRALLTGRNHVWFQKSSFQINVMIRQRLVLGSQNLEVNQSKSECIVVIEHCSLYSGWKSWEKR